MEYIKIKDILEFKKKSKIKASEGLKIGKYNFYTSSREQNKFLDYYEYSMKLLLLEQVEMLTYIIPMENFLYLLIVLFWKIKIIKFF